MSSPSSREAHLLGDIVREAERIETFLSGVTRETFIESIEKAYAVQKALQNVCEACIQLDGKKGAGRFAILLPNQHLGEIKEVGDRLRHDYGAMDPGLVWTQVERLVPELKVEAEAQLSALRRLHGQDG